MLKNIPADQKRLTLSTGLTLLRIALVPCIVGAMLTDRWGIAFSLFIVAAITDVLDGALARWRNEQTFLGAILDPIADKFLLIACFATLAFLQSPLYGIPIWFVIVILVKELVMVIGALVLYFVKGSVEIRPTLLGKATTFIQISFIGWLFACYFFDWMPIKTYHTLMGVMLAAVIISFIQYLGIGFKQLSKT